MVERQVLRDLLHRWHRGELSAQDVHEIAEDLWQADPPGDYEEGDPRSIAAEVLSQLEAMNHQWITLEDIPAMLALLDTPHGEEPSGWAMWRRYWDGIDWKRRQRQLQGSGFYTA